MKKMIKRVAHGVESLLRAVGEAAEGPLGTREMSTTEAEVQNESEARKREVLGWLEQRQAYVDDALNGRQQSMADVLNETRADVKSMKAPEWHDWKWDDASGQYVRDADRSKKP
jgi:hypothetical protein